MYFYVKNEWFLSAVKIVPVANRPDLILDKQR